MATGLQCYPGIQSHWLLIGPFPNDEKSSGHAAVYPPETEPFSPEAEYDGLGGKVRWQEYRKDQWASVCLTEVFQPKRHMCAYALCFVTCLGERQIQIRVGMSDAGKLWVGGELALDYPYPGTAWLDRDVVPVTLHAGTTPILLKVCTGLRQWGFILRLTNPDGTPFAAGTVSLTSP